MGIDKFARSSLKKLREARGPLGSPGERGEQGIQGPPGKKGLMGESGEVGNGFNTTSDGDFDIGGKGLSNIGNPIELSGAPTLYTVSDAILNAENPLWKEIPALKEYSVAQNVEIYDKLEMYLLRYYMNKAITKN